MLTSSVATPAVEVISLEEQLQQILPPPKSALATPGVHRLFGHPEWRFGFEEADLAPMVGRNSQNVDGECPLLGTVAWLEG